MPFVIDNIQYTINLSNDILVIKAYDLLSKIKYHTKLMRISIQSYSIFRSADIIYRALVDCFKKQQNINFGMVTGRLSSSSPYIKLSYHNVISNEKEHIYFWLSVRELNANEQQLQKNLESINDKVVSLENEIIKFTNILDELKDHYKNYYVGPYTI